MTTQLMQKLHSTLNLTDLTICYGMTETSPVSLMTRPTDPLPKRISSVGTLLPHVSAKIVDPEHRTRIVGIGEKGELAVSGYLVMKGYWGDEVRTKEVRVKDEKGEVWMFTGDEAVMDEDGFVSITGRIRDLVSPTTPSKTVSADFLFCHSRAVLIDILTRPYRS